MKPVQRVHANADSKKRPAKPLALMLSKRTQGSALTESLQGERPRKVLEKFETLTEAQRKLVLAKFLNKTNQEDKMRLDFDRLLQVKNTPLAAVRLLERFEPTFARQSFVTRVLESSKSMDSGHDFPRSKNFVELGERQRNNLGCMMSEPAVKTAKLFLPNDTTADKRHPNAPEHHVQQHVVQEVCSA
jgi:hypothetical protein